MGILDDWIEDMPQQFQGKERIEALISVFARQIEELYKVFTQLDTETDLESAVGINLDMVGDILCLSRKDGNAIIRKTKGYTMTDDVYRKVLKYKTILNSCECTYADIMRSIALLWDADDIVYLEPKDRPATVLLTMPMVSLDAIDPAIGKVLTIKAAGVSLIYTIDYLEKFYFMHYEKFAFLNLHMRWKLKFYSFVFGEYKKLDGTWLLDGKTLLDAMSIDVPISIIYKGIKVIFKEYVKENHINLRADAKNNGRTLMQRMYLRAKFNQTARKICYLDGSKRLESERWPMPAYLIIKSIVDAKENISLRESHVVCVSNKERIESNMGFLTYLEHCCKPSEGNVKVTFLVDDSTENIESTLISKRNIWYLDGSQCLDGSRYLNAIEKKEEI